MPHLWTEPFVQWTAHVEQHSMAKQLYRLGVVAGSSGAERCEGLHSANCWGELWRWGVQGSASEGVGRTETFATAV